MADFNQVIRNLADEINNLKQQNDQLTDQLAKADWREKRLEKILQRYESGQLQPLKQRCKELEQTLKESDSDLGVTQQQLSKCENILEEIQAVFVDNDACPLFEPFNASNLSNWLNNFSIKQKTEILEKFVHISGAMANHWCDKELAGYMMFHSDVVAELKKLRKEKNNGNG